MKKTTSKIAAIIMLCAIFITIPLNTQAQFSGGNGTESNPYIITTAEELAQLATYVNMGIEIYDTYGKYFKLGNDIDLSAYQTGTGWIPIGISGIHNEFRGNFDGGNHKITNLYGERSLFGWFGYGTIKNLGVEGVNITGSGTCGGIVGYASSGSVSNCYTTGSIVGGYVGGIVGWATQPCSISNCYTTVSIIGSSYGGGIVGYGSGGMGSASISNCAVLSKKVNGAICVRVGYGILVGNVAFDGILNSDNVPVWTPKGATTINGQDISAIAIHLDGTIGGRFTAANGWITENGKLPGLFGNSVDMPEHLLLSIPQIITEEALNTPVGIAYNQQLFATGTQPITWSIISGSLPDGLTLSTVGVISGTPTIAGSTSNFTVKATNELGFDTKELSISISIPNGYPDITTNTLPAGMIGTFYNQYLTATGLTPITWSLHSGTLPQGLYINASGQIYGTPVTSIGTFNFTVKATNSNGSTIKDLSIVIASGQPVITTETLPDGTEELYYFQMLTATGTAPITWSIVSGALPPGLSFVSYTISGYPSIAGTFNFTVQATNSMGSDTKALSITIVAATVPPTITTTTIPDGTVGTSYNQTLSATGTTPINWSLASGNLPTNLTLSTTGTISGTPTTVGTFNFTVQATNSAGNATKALSITINGVAPVITTTTLPNGTVEVAYNQTLTATGTQPITWSVIGGSLPTNLTLSPAGVISGTPTATGTFNFTVQASNSGGNATKALSITINGITPVITTTSLPNGTIDVAYNQALTATGTQPITWSVISGNLPTNLTLSTTGTISGTPTAVGTFSFTVQASNSAGNTTKALSIMINGVAPVITTTTLPGGIVGTTYSTQLAATGTTPITWSLENGNLPNGLTLSTAGVISGTPIAAGASNFMIKATNSAGSNTKPLSITITTTTVAPTITTATLPDGKTSTAYSAQLEATGTAPITWSLENGNLPNGLTLSAVGEISGIPTAAGVSNFTVKATNSAGSDTKPLSITVTTSVIVPAITTIILPDGKTGTEYSAQLEATGTAPIAWSLASGNLPTGLTLYSGGIISGMPTTIGTFNFTVQATNSAGNDTKALSIKIENGVGVSENEIGNISIYPNPTTGELTIEIAGQARNDVASVEIFDMFGKTLLSNHLITSSSHHLINISHLSAGIYFVKIRTEVGEVIKKVVKE